MSAKLTSSMLEYPADSKSSGTVVLEKSIFYQEDKIAGVTEADEIKIISQINSCDQHVMRFKSTGVPGTVEFSSLSGRTLAIRFYAAESDLDNDGFPDCAELDSDSDRKAFTEWFVRIAESQFMKKNYTWNKKERDCAGLIRYAYREALKNHDSKWLKRSGIVLDKNLSDIIKFNYPDIPVLGKHIFKIRQGSAYDSKTFSSFADAGTLLNYNTAFVSRNINDADKGDVLFFQDDSNIRYPYHSMIVCNAKGGKISLLYHTGSEDDVIKRISLDYLNSSTMFRPVAWNKNFLGVYKFLILE